MFSSRLVTTLLSLTSAALAMPKADMTLDTKDLSTNTTCWVSNIHSVCDGHDNGCTPEGIYVSCQPSNYGGRMIFSNMCSPPGEPHGTLPGTCHCVEGTGESSC